jgi:sentrin-specific protease 1
VNANEHKIQVLDSYGTLFGREDLEDTVSFKYFGYLYLFLPIAHINKYMYKQLKGLRKQLEYVLQCTHLEKHDWPDVRVDTWEKHEVIKTKIQRDG